MPIQEMPSFWGSMGEGFQGMLQNAMMMYMLKKLYPEGLGAGGAQGANAMMGAGKMPPGAGGLTMGMPQGGVPFAQGYGMPPGGLPQGMGARPQLPMTMGMPPGAGGMPPQMGMQQPGMMPTGMPQAGMPQGIDIQQLLRLLAMRGGGGGGTFGGTRAF